MSIPLVMGPSGPLPTSPGNLQQALIQGVAATNPGYTASLPGSLIEDISSTDVGALVMIDQARVDAINSVTPYGANAFVLAQLGQQFGIAQGLPTNANVYVVFSGPAGYVLSPNFLVSDGTNQYALQDGGIIQANGQSPPLYAVCTNSNIFAIPANTIDQIVTSVPSPYTVTVNNPEAGTPATGAESVPSYRSRVLLAGKVGVSGTPAYLKTLLYEITGVLQQYVSINQVTGGWQVIAGGGDAYSIANAILQAVPDISTLQGSQLAITAMTEANPVVITTNLNHNFIVGDTFVVSGANPATYDGTYTVASVTATTITTTTNGSTFGAYVSGAIFTPNPRDITATVFQNPDSYNIVFVNPPQQIVTMTVTWNTTLPNFTAGAAVNQLAAQPLQSYINSIPVGQPINLLEATSIFQEAVSALLATVNVTTLTFAVTINGIAVAPSAGTSIIEGDPESYFYASATAITVQQG